MSNFVTCFGTSNFTSFLNRFKNNQLCESKLSCNKLIYHKFYNFFK